MADRLHLASQHRRILVDLLREHLPEAEAWAYGSRVNGRSHEGSDLDLALRGPGLEELPWERLLEFEAAIRESDIPILVEAMDWARLPERFQREIEREYVVLDAGLRTGHRHPWPVVQLGSLVDLHKEQMDPSTMPNRVFSHHSIPAFDDGKRPVSEFGAQIGSKKFTVPDDAVLVSRINPRFVRVWTPMIDDHARAICSTEYLVLRPRRDLMDRRFLHFLCTAPSFRGPLLERVTGTSGSHQRVSPESALGIEVPLPRLPEQRAIAHVLGALDDKIELNRRMNETLEGMARALFKSWFVDFDPVRAKMEGRDTGLPQEVADLFPDRMVDSEMGEIPEGWEVNPLDVIARFQNGLALQKYRPQERESRLPVVKIAQLRAGEANSGEWASRAIKPECVIEDGDVLFSWSGSLLVRVWCGGQAALNQHLFKVTSGQYPKWLYLHLLLSHLRRFQRIAQDKATTMGHIRRHHLTEALCAVPPKRVIAALSGTFSGMLARQVASEMSIRTLAALRDALLPKLVSGELRVPDAEALLDSAL